MTHCIVIAWELPGGSPAKYFACKPSHCSCLVHLFPLGLDLARHYWSGHRHLGSSHRHPLWLVIPDSQSTCHTTTLLDVLPPHSHNIVILQWVFRPQLFLKLQLHLLLKCWLPFNLQLPLSILSSLLLLDICLFIQYNTQMFLCIFDEFLVVYEIYACMTKHGVWVCVEHD